MMAKKMWLVTVLLSVASVLVFAGGQADADGVATGEPVTMTFVSPRGTLEVMDDYPLWVAKEMGYFEEFGIDPVLEPGPNEALADIKMIYQGKADIGYPSPGVLTSGIDVGVDVIMVYEMMASQVFDFGVRKDSGIESVQDLEGATISIGWAGWDVIVKPMLAEVGIDASTVTFVTAGAQWGQAVATGNADAALCWRGLRAQWDAVGMDLRYILGEDFSEHPANGLVARKGDLEDPIKRQNLINYLKCVTMGIEFARQNPRAAAQLTYDLFPAVQEQMDPQLALESMNQLHWAYTESYRKLGGYGMLPEDGWASYLEIIADLGQTSKKLDLEDVITNELIAEVNDIDFERVKKDAMAFELNDEWSAVKVDGNW